MSYSALVSFKKLEDTETIHSFFRDFKKALLDNMQNIVEDNWSYCPLCKISNLNSEDVFLKIKEEERDRYEESRKWFYQLFSYRWTFIPEHNMIAVFGVPKVLYPYFDGTVCFQNSCDQDYTIDCYSGISLFEEIWNKWDQEDPFVVKEAIKVQYDDYSAEDLEDRERLDYYRRQFAYDEIFDFVDGTLFDDDSAVYISMFHVYDVIYESRFLLKCLDIAKKELLAT